MKSKCVAFISALLLMFATVCIGYGKGIYVTSSTATVTKQMKYLISEAKALGIDTFIIDVDGRNTRYAKNIALVKQSGIRYVARLVVFPDGGTPVQVASQALWEKRWKQAQYAISLGAEAIQLDYIRYKHSNRASPQNAQNVLKVIQFFREKMRGTNVELQADIFGIAADAPSHHIGHDAKVLAPQLHAINPMVYPSHYEPFRQHAVTPYETVYNSVSRLKKQLENYPDVKVNAYIEVHNYRYPMSSAQKAKYIKAQIRGAKDAGADGYYVWSPMNKYKLFFSVLREGV